MWQKAKIIIDPDHKYEGKEIWVKSEVPQIWLGQYRDEPLEWEKSYEINLFLYPHSPKSMLVQADQVELLARGPEDFAQDVPFMTLEEWERQNDK